MPRRSKRQDELLAQLVEIFLVEGFAHFPVEELAVRLRASKSTLYTLGASKEQLFTTVVRAFFRTAADQVEHRVAAEGDPLRRIKTYLDGIAVALAPASPQFYADLDNLAPTREIYAMNTRMAGVRVRELVAAAERPERPVNSAFLGAAAAAVMESIQQGRLRHLSSHGGSSATGVGAAHPAGFNDAEAYRGLAELLVAGLR